MSEQINYFNELSKINVNDHVEKKGKFSYLSWAWAVDVLRKKHPTATWEVIRFEGMPFMQTPLGYFVEVAVTVEGITLSQIHPVLDNQNKPIEKPNTFQINTSIQRCLVKAIALHGLGLYIYSGEDLPPDPEAEKAAKEEAENKIRTDIKIKWQTVNGSLDGMDEWIEEQLGKGKSFNALQVIVTKRALEKAQEAKQHAE
ncbi:DUF1071 domain-containing protein [Paenibacillus nicotianae]|uniref:DUF1071 domain-containing protein n=1 Tax=Paenibacillus nicotianae TaxID=1526551 RepID=A0ABW4UXP2_9BACL